jgi:hypothetical protein
MGMTAIRRRTATGSIIGGAAVALTAIWPAAWAAAQPIAEVAPAAPEAGFDLVVVGGLPGVEPERFALAVAEALPERLLDPQANFTRQPGYDAETSYRLHVVFHGEGDVVAPETLCTSPDPEAEPPAPAEDLMAATQVAAAFCAEDAVLSTATDRMLGSVTPGQAGFRFLVADIAKQLFPDGFDTLPGTGTLAAPVE